MLRQRLENYFTRRWYERSAKHWLWGPLSRFYESKVRQKRQVYLQGSSMQSATALPPVLVVGNLTVGGTGKTPLIIFLVEQLRDQGMRVAVLSRGYGGTSRLFPIQVDATSTPKTVGDEPYMIYQRTGIHLAVDPDRYRGLCYLAQQADFDLVLSDDGMQHYRLPRQYEIAVIDGSRGLGNGACLPAGPLREPLERLDSVNAIVVNGTASDQLQQQLAGAKPPVFTMYLQPEQFVDLSGNPTALDTFQGTTDIQAIAAIGNPQRFFAALADLGIECQTRSFSDHHDYSLADVKPWLGKPLIMTEKDAVKLAKVLPPETHGQAFYLAVSARLDEGLINDILTRFKGA